MPLTWDHFLIDGKLIRALHRAARSKYRRTSRHLTGRLGNEIEVSIRGLARETT